MMRYELGERMSPAVGVCGYQRQRFVMDVDTVSCGHRQQGQSADSANHARAEFNQWGNIVVDENCRTSLKGCMR